MSTQLYNLPGHLLRRAHQISNALFAEEWPYDLTSVQYAALRAIHDNQGIDATTLAAIIFFDRSTVGGVLERLEVKDLILRAGSRDDKRIKVLYVTPKGADLLQTVEPLVQRVQQRILEPLSEHDRNEFMRIMTQLVNLHADNMPSSVRTVVNQSGAPTASVT
jgi:DNA-binding MarR family transcriptional regulator